MEDRAEKVACGALATAFGVMFAGHLDRRQT